MPQVQVVNSDSLGWQSAYRPVEGPHVRVNKNTGEIQYQHRNSPGIWINSALRKDEWEFLDQTIVETAGPRTDVFSRIPKVNHQSIGVMLHQYNTVSQMTEAEVSMLGEASGETGAIEFNLAGVPIPVIYKVVPYGERFLQASRLQGGGYSVDATMIAEATRVVVEQAANILYNGRSAVNFNGSTIYGLATQPNINTGTASGDFGTISNIQPTILAMIAALVADNYFGPYEVDIASVQYTEATATYSDGSGQTAIDRILTHPKVTAVNSNDQIAAGGLIVRETGRHILEWAQVQLGGQVVNELEIALIEWMSGDGMVNHFKVMLVGTPVVKADFATQSGVAYYTGA